MGRIFNEDCRQTLLRSDIGYHYALLSPPDFAQLGWHPTKDYSRYCSFLGEVVLNLRPRNGVFTVVVTDRKHGGRLVAKHRLIEEWAEQGGYRLHSHKIWARSLKRDLFRPTFSHVLSFAKGAIRTHSQADYAPDVWFEKPSAGERRHGAFPLSLVERCLLHFTVSGQCVLDPFMGTGTVPVAAQALRRDFIGIEIDPALCQEAEMRLRSCSP